MADSPSDAPLIRKAIDDYQKIVNYRYWRTRGQSEAETETADAHRNFYEAGEQFKKQNWDEALTLLDTAMNQFEQVLSRFSALRDEDEMVEECLLVVKMWNEIHRLQGAKPPQDFPLKQVWQNHQWRMAEVDKEYRRRFLTTAE